VLSILFLVYFKIRFLSKQYGFSYSFVLSLFFIAFISFKLFLFVTLEKFSLVSVSQQKKILFLF